MTATTLPARSAGTARTLVVLLAAAAVVCAAGLLVAAGAHAAGADPSYPPLTPAVLLPFAVAGLAAGIGGWAIVRRLVRRPAVVLAVLVPTLLVLSWIPDLLFAPGIPGADTTGVIALVLMHPIVVAVVVPVAARIAPVPRGPRA